MCHGLLAEKRPQDPVYKERCQAWQPTQRCKEMFQDVGRRQLSTMRFTLGVCYRQGWVEIDFVGSIASRLIVPRIGQKI